MPFTRSEIREILGEAHTDDIAAKLIKLHRSVIDPLKDDLDSANREAAKYKAEAEKLPEIRKELEDFKKEDWKAKYEKEKADHDAYKTKIAQDAETAKVKAAYKKLLVEEQISEKTLDSILNVTDYSNIKLKADGTLDKVEDLKKNIADKWGGFKETTRQRGENVDHPAGGAAGGSDSSVRDMVKNWHAQRFGASPVETSVSGPQKQ